MVSFIIYPSFFCLFNSILRRNFSAISYTEGDIVDFLISLIVFEHVNSVFRNQVVEELTSSKNSLIILSEICLCLIYMTIVHKFLFERSLLIALFSRSHSLYRLLSVAAVANNVIKLTTVSLKVLISLLPTGVVTSIQKVILNHK